MQVQKLLEEHNYDGLGNFLDLYRDFNNSGCTNFFEFFQSYSPRITSAHHTCVGLALELWNRLCGNLERAFPDLSKHLFLVSCEEKIDYLREYTALSERLNSAAYALEKEHVLLCLKVEISGRKGLILCDPGYHVARVVSVMHDKAYPNTGWFMQSEEGGVQKEYNYLFSPMNEKFVEWKERTTRNCSLQEVSTALIYVARPYLTAVDVTERRNLVYNFRSLASRDQKGHLLAGIYFKVKEGCEDFTIFYQDMGKQRLKLKFSTFNLPLYQISEKTVNIITICNEQLNMPEGLLLELLKRSGELMADKNYVRQLLEVNECIDLMSANN